MIIDPSNLQRRDVYKLLISIIVPRPIAFISTISTEGVYNAAPYSFFNGCSSDPPLCIISIDRRRGEKKDTLQNIEDTGEFTVNMVTEEIAERMNLSSGDYPAHVSELDITGLTSVPCQNIKSFRIAESPVNMECILENTLEIGNSPSTLVIGRIVLFHIDDSLYKDGAITPDNYRIIGRLGIDTYCYVRELFHMVRPRINPDDFPKE